MVGMAEILLDVQQMDEAIRLARQVSRMVSGWTNQKYMEIDVGGSQVFGRPKAAGCLDC